MGERLLTRNLFLDDGRGGDQSFHCEVSKTNLSSPRPDAVFEGTKLPVIEGSTPDARSRVPGASRVPPGRADAQHRSRPRWSWAAIGWTCPAARRELPKRPGWVTVSGFRCVKRVRRVTRVRPWHFGRAEGIGRISGFPPS